MLLLLHPIFASARSALGEPAGTREKGEEEREAETKDGDTGGGRRGRTEEERPEREVEGDPGQTLQAWRPSTLPIPNTSMLTTFYWVIDRMRCSVP
jgi:hypothetical protein